MSRKDLIDYAKEEIGDKLDEHTGCIIFDFGAYFPYSKPLKFDFQIGSNELPDKKLNHRYPSKAYHTISKTNGRKVSKIGYAYYIDLDDNKNCKGEQLMLLALEVGWANEGEEVKETAKFIIPLKLSLTPEKPICQLQMNFNILEGRMDFTSYYPAEDGGWKEKFWSNKENESEYIEKSSLLVGKIVEDEKTGEAYADVFEPPIEPVPTTLDKCLFIE